MQAFLQTMGQCLETEVTADTEFKTLDGWCSLMAFSMLLALERQFACRLTIGELMATRTLGELYRKLGA